MYTNFSQNQQTISTFFLNWKNNWNNELCQVFFFFLEAIFILSLISYLSPIPIFVSYRKLFQRLRMGTTDITRHVNSLLANIIGKCRFACDFKQVRSRIFFPPLQFCHLLYRIKFSWKVTYRGSTNFFHLKKCVSVQFGIADGNVLYLRVNALSTLNNVIKNCRHRVPRYTFKIYLFPYEPYELISLISRFFENIEARTKLKKVMHFINRT